MSYLVTTDVAAFALGVPPQQVEAWAAAGVITPAHAAPRATRLWDVEQLREQVRRHLEEDAR
jgi:DNA-binding transcriptional MerR regulator